MKIKAFNNLISYCEKEKLKGWDPYDGLNSWVIQKTLLGRSRFFRLAWTQLFKLNPINLRPLFGIKKEYNPKGLGLFLIGYCNLYTKTNKKEYLDKIRFISNEILQLQTKGYSGACWGYNFDWQARAFFQPKYTPTVVATSFIVEALFQAYKITRDIKLIETASSASHFILKDLNKTHDEQGNYTLSYSPLDKTQVFNAGLLGAKTLALIYEHTNEDYLLNEAKKIVDYVCSKQNPDGSWAYGTLPFHQWVDSFHTGYNLECIYIYQKISGDLIYQKNIDKGLDYYLNNFFTEEGMSKYYNNKTYPIDIHAPAQLVVTLAKMQKLNEHRPLVDKVLLWTIDNMQSSKGFFYYQRGKTVTTRISYIRWAQSWMFYALSYYEIKIS